MKEWKDKRSSQFYLKFLLSFLDGIRQESNPFLLKKDPTPAPEEREINSMNGFSNLASQEISLMLADSGSVINNDNNFNNVA